MISKALMWFGMLVVAIVGFYVYKHYRHTWGYDDDTQIHDYSTPTSRLDAPPVAPPTRVVVRLAA